MNCNHKESTNGERLYFKVLTTGYEHKPESKNLYPDLIPEKVYENLMGVVVAVTNDVKSHKTPAYLYLKDRWPVPIMSDCPQCLKEADFVFGPDTGNGDTWVEVPTMYMEVIRNLYNIQ